MKKLFNKIILSLIFLLVFLTSAYSAPYKKEKQVHVTVKNELNCRITATIFEYTTRNTVRCFRHGPFDVFPKRESHKRIRVYKNTLWLRVYINRVEIKKLQFIVSDASQQSIKIIVKPGRQKISLVVQ